MKIRILWYIVAIATVLLLSALAAMYYIFTAGTVDPAVMDGNSRTQLVLYASLKEKQLDTIEKAFERNTPGIDLICYSTGSGKAGASLMGLASEGISEAPDLVWLADPNAFIDLLEGNKLAPYEGRYSEQIHSMYPFIDSHLTVVRKIRMGFACNRYSFQSDAFPSAWKDLEKTGKVLFADPYNSGTSFFTLCSLLGDDDYGRPYLDRLHDTGSAIGGGSGAVGYHVGKGTFLIGIIPDYLAAMEEIAGIPIRFIYPTDKDITIPSPIAILRSSNRKWAAERFIDYLLSPEGTKVLSALGLMDAFGNGNTDDSKGFSTAVERDDFLTEIDSIFL